MRSFWYAIIVLSCLPVMLSGCNSEEWKSMPDSIQRFVLHYYPGAVIESYYDNSSGYYVDIKDGASIVFSAPDAWQSLNGNGVTLPRIFIENEMPVTLYRYLLETESVAGVYAVARDARVYRLTMFDSDLVYNISTDKITYTKWDSSASSSISRSPSLSPYAIRR